MLAVLFGLSGAFAFGSADFFGGSASKHIGSLRTSWIATMVALVTLLIAYPFLGGMWSNEAVLWGALSGFAGAFALIFLYASLAIGPMSVLSPVGALVAAVVPVVWDLITGHQLSPLSYVAIVIALIAVWFVGFIPDEKAIRPSLRGLVFAVLAGTLIGTFMIFIDLAPDDAGIVPLIANRTVQVMITAIAVGAISLLHVLRSRGVFGKDGAPRADIAVGDRGALSWRKGVPIAMLSGFIDIIGNTLILFGLVAGSLSVVSVLSSMYPGATILLAALVLKERIARIQYVGLVLALIAAAMLSFG